MTLFRISFQCPLIAWSLRDRYMSHDMTKPTKWVCAQRRLRSAWASAQSDQNLRCPLEESLIRCPGWLDWANAKTDLSLRRVHTHFVSFDMSRLICCELHKISVNGKPSMFEGYQMKQLRHIFKSDTVLQMSGNKKKLVRVFIRCRITRAFVRNILEL